MEKGYIGNLRCVLRNYIDSYHIISKFYIINYFGSIKKYHKGTTKILNITPKRVNVGFQFFQ